MFTHKIPTFLRAFKALREHVQKLGSITLGNNFFDYFNIVQYFSDRLRSILQK
jgi:hypothetical protein